MSDTTKKAFTGADAASWAMKQINPDVVAAYPMTPQTAIVQNFARYVADGLVDTEYVTAESEHSVMSATIGAVAAGGRAMTATSSAGLALMAEMVGVASGLRLPMVMAVANRALSAPINIHGDHSDVYLIKDLGWIQVFSEDPQEVYENMIMAVRISEHPDIQLPVEVNQDGFITSHAVERVDVLEDATVQEFVGQKKLDKYLLDLEHPVTIGPLELQDYYFETQKQRNDAMFKAMEVIPQIEAEFSKITGKIYGWLEEYRMDDAEVAIVVMSSTAGTAKGVVDAMREQGKKVGLIKPRYIRPFPADALVASLKKVKRAAVMDRAISFGAEGGALFNELSSAMYQRDGQTHMQSILFGLGGRDITPADIEGIFQGLLDGDEQLIKYVGVRE